MVSRYTFEVVAVVFLVFCPLRPFLQQFSFSLVLLSYFSVGCYLWDFVGFDGHSPSVCGRRG